MGDFNYTQYRKNNPLLKEESSQNELSRYLESSAQQCFHYGGNGQNLLDNAGDLAAFIDSNMVTARRNSPEEPGWYSKETADAFKKLIDSMVEDEVKSNPAHEDDDNNYDEFVDMINKLD